jgi:hypothetical protein
MLLKSVYSLIISILIVDMFSDNASAQSEPGVDSEYLLWYALFCPFSPNNTYLNTFFYNLKRIQLEVESVRMVRAFVGPTNVM